MTIEAKQDKTNELLEKILTVLTPAASAPPTTPAPEVVKPKIVLAAAVKPAVVTPATLPAVPEVEETFDFDTEATGTDTPKLTVDDARRALVALQRAKGAPEASRKILAANKLASLASLKDENQDLIAKIIKDCKAAGG